MTRYLHSGSTLLNLALTGKAECGWPLGRVVNLVGDRSTGKTLMAIEAATLFFRLPESYKPKVTFFEAEAAFDEEYAQSLGMPIEKVNFVREQTVESLYDQLEALIKEPDDGSHHLFVIDSLDALTTESELGKEIRKGSYNMSKQKLLNEIFRKLVKPLSDRNITLFLLSQVRMNIDPKSYQKFDRAGGKGLDHFASHIVWFKMVGTLKKSDAVDRPYGIEIECNVTKNKTSSPLRKVRFPLIFKYGIDEIDSLIRFLSSADCKKFERSIEQRGAYFYWPGDKKAKGMQRETLIKSIESDPSRYAELVAMTQAAWDWLEDKTQVTRAQKTTFIKEAYLIGGDPPT